MAGGLEVQSILLVPWSLCTALICDLETNSEMAPSQPYWKACFWGLLQGFIWYLPSKLEEGVCLPAAQAFTPRPCFRVLEWPQPLPPVPEVQEPVYLIECLGSEVKVKLFWRKQLISKDDMTTCLFILHPLSPRVSFSALNKHFKYTVYGFSCKVHCGLAGECPVSQAQISLDTRRCWAMVSKDQLHTAPCSWTVDSSWYCWTAMGWLMLSA